MNRLAIVLLAGLCWILQAREARTAEIGFIEDFALAADRELPLAQLIPGTEDYYYYHCLHYQNQQQYDRVEALLTDWIERHKVTPRVQEIQHRQALLTYGQDSAKTLQYLQKQLDLRFDHQRDTLDRAAELPTRLDESLITRDRLTQVALDRHRDNLDGFEDSALQWLATQQLDPARRRNLLQRLQRPDVTGLSRLIVDDLNAPNSPGFGAYPIHGQLLQEQLDELLQLKPALRNETQLVNTYLAKLRPNPDVDWQNDRQAAAGVFGSPLELRLDAGSQPQFAQGPRALPSAGIGHEPGPLRQAAVHDLPAIAAPGELRESALPG